MMPERLYVVFAGLFAILAIAFAGCSALAPHADEPLSGNGRNLYTGPVENAAAFVSGFRFAWNRTPHRVSILGADIPRQEKCEERSCILSDLSIDCLGGDWTFMDKWSYEVRVTALGANHLQFQTGKSTIGMVGGHGELHEEIILNESLAAFDQVAIFLAGFGYDTNPQYPHGYPITQMGAGIRNVERTGPDRIKVHFFSDLEAGDRDFRRGFGNDYRATGTVSYLLIGFAGSKTDSRHHIQTISRKPAEHAQRLWAVAGERGYPDATFGLTSFHINWNGEAHYLRSISVMPLMQIHNPLTGLCEIDMDAQISNAGLIAYETRNDLTFTGSLLQFDDQSFVETSHCEQGTQNEQSLKTQLSVHFDNGN